MKYLLLISLSAILGACASKPHQNLVVDQSSQLFGQESLLRVGQTSPEADMLKNCYQGDLKGFTQAARTEYAKGAKNARYWVWVGNCLAWHDELKEAGFYLGVAEGLAKGKDEEAMVKNNLGVIYLRVGRISRAYDMFTEARKLAPHMVTPAFNLAQLYVSQNLNQEALKVLSVAPFEKSNDAEVLHLRGLAFLQSGNIKSAAGELSKITGKFHAREDFALTLAHWQLLEGKPQVALDLIAGREKTGSNIHYKLAERLQREAKQQIAALEAKRK